LREFYLIGVLIFLVVESVIIILMQNNKNIKEKNSKIEIIYWVINCIIFMEGFMLQEEGIRVSLLISLICLKNF
jgi:heme/copper-type cytochrome/quinol oxidase subunit 2